MFVRHAFTCKNNDKGFIMDKRPNIIPWQTRCAVTAWVLPGIRMACRFWMPDAEGVRYENAYSACPTCVPARATLYTGMSQEHTGRVGYG